MWKYGVRKSISGSKSIIFTNLLQKNAPKTIFCAAQRFASSSTFNNKQNGENNNTISSSRRYVDVDSPFAKENKYTYAMPRDPYQASKRITRILEIGTIEDAVDYLLALPIYLQTTVLWNQLIGYCSQYGKASYAEKLYSQVNILKYKRRPLIFRPLNKTYI
jgi:hypothetical protein